MLEQKYLTNLGYFHENELKTKLSLNIKQKLIIITTPFQYELMNDACFFEMMLADADNIFVTCS